jgi:RHS repeat-associated protein
VPCARFPSCRDEHEPLIAGLICYIGRWYDTATGRFLSEDPSSFSAGDMNLYAYCGNNPINLTDPTGLCGYSGSSPLGLTYSSPLNLNLGNSYSSYSSPSYSNFSSIVNQSFGGSNSLNYSGSNSIAWPSVSNVSITQSILSDSIFNTSPSLSYNGNLNLSNTYSAPTYASSINSSNINFSIPLGSPASYSNTVSNPAPLLVVNTDPFQPFKSGNELQTILAGISGAVTGGAKAGQVLFSVPRALGITDAVGLEPLMQSNDRLLESQWNNTFIPNNGMDLVARGAANIGGKATYFAAGGGLLNYALGSSATVATTLSSPFVTVPTTGALAYTGYEYGKASYYAAQSGDYRSAIDYGVDAGFSSIFAGYTGAQAYSSIIRTTPTGILLEQPRDALGRFAPKVGGEVPPGSIAESATWDAIANKPGWSVIPGRVYVRDATGQIRVYDGVATSPSGRNIGIEVKSGTGKLTNE